MFAHVSESGNRMHQHIPFPLSILGPKYEYMMMKLLGIMSDTNWLYRFRITRWIVDKLANQVVIPIIHGEVVTPDEIDSLVHQLEKEGHPIYVGICECRHGENRIDPEMVEGHDPNYTCVMIGDWGKGHIYSYPSYYKPINADDLMEQTRFWHAGAGCSTPGASVPATVSSSPTATASPSTASPAPPVQARRHRVHARLPLRRGRPGEVPGRRMNASGTAPATAGSTPSASKAASRGRHQALPRLRPVLQYCPTGAASSRAQGELRALPIAPTTSFTPRPAPYPRSAASEADSGKQGYYPV